MNERFKAQLPWFFRATVVSLRRRVWRDLSLTDSSAYRNDRDLWFGVLSRQMLAGWRCRVEAGSAGSTANGSPPELTGCRIVPQKNDVVICLPSPSRSSKASAWRSVSPAVQVNVESVRPRRVGGTENNRGTPSSALFAIQRESSHRAASFQSGSFLPLRLAGGC